MNAEDNRNSMPTVAAMVDKCREYFGNGVSVKYASENGVTRGVQPICEGVTVPPAVISKRSPAIPTTTIYKRIPTRRP